jgi:hypothetical protein
MPDLALRHMPPYLNSVRSILRTIVQRLGTGLPNAWITRHGITAAQYQAEFETNTANVSCRVIM